MNEGHAWKVYFGGNHYGSVRTAELAACLCARLGDGATVKRDGRICWKQGIVMCTSSQAAALMDSASRRDAHGEIVRNIFARYRGPRFNHEQMVRSIQRKLGHTTGVWEMEATR